MLLLKWARWQNSRPKPLTQDTTKNSILRSWKLSHEEDQRNLKNPRLRKSSQQKGYLNQPTWAISSISNLISQLGVLQVAKTGWQLLRVCKKIRSSWNKKTSWLLRHSIYNSSLWWDCRTPGKLTSIFATHLLIWVRPRVFDLTSC